MCIRDRLYLLTTVALAVSTIRLAKQRVLLHDMKSIETLARVDVLCVDKTGTITENKMTVNDLVYSEEIPKEVADNLETIISDFASNMTSDNITMEAIKERFKDVSGRSAVSKTSFSSKVKYCSVTYSDECYVLGAPEMAVSYTHLDVYKRQGIGIAKEDLPRIFDRGYTGYNGRKDKKATGLGLYLTKQILDRLNHKIEIDSQIGVGTRVFIKF